MFVCVVKNHVKEESVAEYIEVTKKFANDMKNINGCKDSFVLQDIENKAIVVNVEIWDSEVSKINDTGEVFKKYKPELKKYFLSNQTETYIIQ